MRLQRGVAADRQVLPTEWADRAVTRDQELIDTIATSYSGDPSNPEAFYHDCWRVWDATLGCYAATGWEARTC